MQGLGHCKACSPGYYQNLPGASTCLTCSAGSFSYANSLSCITCPRGSMTASGGLAKCSTCAAGFYANMDPGLTGPLTNGTPGATSCLACPVGTFSFPSSAGVEDCIKCPINTTADRVGMKACDTCPVGYHTCSFGSTKCTLIPCTTPPAPPPHYPVLPRPSHASPAYGSYGSPIWDGPSSSPPSSNMVSRGTLCKSNTSLASSTPLLMIMRIPVKLVSYDITSFL